jgi:DnaK suppressor protein
MTSHLTAGQRALLEAALAQRQHQLDRRLAEHHDGLTRVDHARELLLQDGDDAPQRDNARTTDLAITDIETQELGAVSQALGRLHQPGFGVCSDCGEDIPFDRLKVEPWALRCVACESAREAPRSGSQRPA